MLLAILAAALAGILAGIVTGLIPGVHVNLVAALLLVSYPMWSANFGMLPAACFIVALATTHSFLDFIPSTFLGVPDSGTELAVLPAHQMVLDGEGRKAVMLSLVGSLFSLVLAALIVPLMLFLVGHFYEMISDYIGIMLLLIVIWLLSHDWKRGQSLLIFVLSGTLGFIAFNIATLDSPLFGLLSGLFGVSVLTESLMTASSIPEQKSSCELPEKRLLLLPVAAATIAGALTSVFPGLGSAQGAAIASPMVKEIDQERYLVLVGGINTVNFVLSLVTFVTLGKARNGAVSAISNLMSINTDGFWILLSVCLIAGALSTPLCMFLSTGFCKVMAKVPYRAMVASIIIAIVIICFALSSFLGLLLLLTSTALGFLTSKLGVRRQYQMGCLILPVLVYFLL